MAGFDLINAVLEDDVILEIFRHVESKSDHDACSLVCKRWRSLEHLRRYTIRIGASASPSNVIELLRQHFINIRYVFIDERASKLLTGESKKRRRAGQPLSLRGKLPDGTETNFLSDSELAVVAESFLHLQKLSLAWCTGVTDVGLRSFIWKRNSLKSLDLQGCCIGDDVFAALGECSNCLEDVNLQFVEGVTDAGVVQLAIGCGRTLKSLGILACPRITDVALEAVGSHCRSLESLSLSSEFFHNQGLLSVAGGCSMLRVLKLECENITDDALEAVGSLCLMLELLSLYCSRKFTDRSLYAIGRGCKKLKSLTLSNCDTLTNTGVDYVAVGCPELMYIEINGCQNIGTEGVKSIRRFCDQLSALALMCCQTTHDALSIIGNGCKFLQALQLVECSGIGDDSICSIAGECKNLKKLHIRRCPQVGNKGIVAVSQNSKSLSDLSLQFCDRVGDEALIAIGQGCCSLRNLNISGCQRVGNDGIIAIARGCPQLCHLDVSLVQNMGNPAMWELAEGCPLLHDLVLSHCRQITDTGLGCISAKCKLLESCHMVYCKEITAAGVDTMIASCSRMKKLFVEKRKVSESTRTRAGPIIRYLPDDDTNAAPGANAAPFGH